MHEPWEEPVETEYGSVRWREVGDPIGNRYCYLMLAKSGQEYSVVVGYMTVEDPEIIDEDTRRPSDPIDRRIDTMWIHPNARHQGIGKTLGLVARQYKLFESHSLTRTADGTAWARSLGDTPPPAEAEPSEEDFEKGARRYYLNLLQAYPYFVGLADF